MDSLPQYKINIDSRKYDIYAFIDMKTMEACETTQLSTINPIQEKLFNHDIIELSDNTCKVLHSTVKLSGNIPGVMILKTIASMEDIKQSSYINVFQMISVCLYS